MTTGPNFVAVNHAGILSAADRLMVVEAHFHTEWDLAQRVVMTVTDGKEYLPLWF